MTEFRSKGRGEGKKVYPINKRRPYGESRRKAEKDVKRLRDSGKRTRLIETNRRLRLYAPYESILKGGRILSVTHSLSRPKEIAAATDKTPEVPKESGQKVEPERNEKPAPGLPEHKPLGSGGDYAEFVSKAEEWRKTHPDAVTEEDLKRYREGYQDIGDTESWEKFLEELRKRPRSKVSKTKQEQERAHNRENYNRLVREIGRVRDKAKTKDGLKIPLNAKIKVNPGGEIADFFDKDRYVMSIGFNVEKGPRSYHDIYFVHVNPDLLKEEKSHLRNGAAEWGDGVTRVGTTEKSWQDAVRWANESIDFNKLEKGEA